MPRMTRQTQEGGRYVIDPALLETTAEGYGGAAVNRLAAFENMHEHLTRRVREIPAELAVMKAQGREKTVTFRELAGQKMMFQLWLETAETYGVEKE